MLLIVVVDFKYLPLGSTIFALEDFTKKKFEVKSDHRSKFSNLSNWKEEAWKNQGFNGIRTRDLRDTGAMLYQLSYEATPDWERGQFIESFFPVQWSDVKYISSLHLQPQYKHELFHIYFRS